MLSSSPAEWSSHHFAEMRTFHRAPPGPKSEAQHTTDALHLPGQFVLIEEIRRPTTGSEACNVVRLGQQIYIPQAHNHHPYYKSDCTEDRLNLYHQPAMTSSWWDYWPCPVRKDASSFNMSKLEVPSTPAPALAPTAMLTSDFSDGLL